MNRFKKYLLPLFLLICHFTNIYGEVKNISINWDSHQLRYTNALASLQIYLDQMERDCGASVTSISNVPFSPSEGFSFTDESLQKLWDRVLSHSPNYLAAAAAYDEFEQFKTEIEMDQLSLALPRIKKSLAIINDLWEASIPKKSIEQPSIDCMLNIFGGQPHYGVDYSAYPHLTSEMKKKFAPYLIPDSHPMKSKLNQIFAHKRVTETKEAFLKAGFKIVSERPRSYVIVARHSLLKDHLIKCYFDTETREKWDRPSWYWLVQRCVGAKILKDVIQHFHFKYFAVAKKWIYILPLLESTPPYKECYKRHPILDIVTDMHLVSEKDNRYAWQHIMNEARLDELYLIITHAKGASYRADNIAYSRSGKFCFIDSEYPSRGPEYYRIGRELNSEMANYWNHLVTNGGK